MGRQSGFTLIEMICVLAIVGLLSMVAFPRMPRSTTHTRLEGYAVQVAALLKADRNAAIRKGAMVSTSLSAASHIVKSGSGEGAVLLPPDVAFDAILAERCAGRPVGGTVDFFPSGSSCGGTIALARQGSGFQIRVNWLTGGIEIVPTDKG